MTDSYDSPALRHFIARQMVGPQPRPCSCGRPGIWQHPTDLTWACESHAPPLKDRARCVACDRRAAVRRPDTHEWLCLWHAGRA